MWRHVSVNGKLEELKKQVDLNEEIQDFVDTKMREQLELLEKRVAELEKELLEKQDFRHIPKKNRLKLVADQRKEQESASGGDEWISVEE